MYQFKFSIEEQEHLFINAIIYLANPVANGMKRNPQELSEHGNGSWMKEVS